MHQLMTKCNGKSSLRQPQKLPHSAVSFTTNPNTKASGRILRSNSTRFQSQEGRPTHNNKEEDSSSAASCDANSTDSSDDKSSSRGLSLSLQSQPLRDIEDQGGRTAKSVLRIILNSKSDIYGEPNSKLCRQAQNKFLRWKTLSSKQYLLLLNRFGILHCHKVLVRSSSPRAQSQCPQDEGLQGAVLSKTLSTPPSSTSRRLNYTTPPVHFARLVSTMQRDHSGHHAVHFGNEGLDHVCEGKRNLYRINITTGNYYQNWLSLPNLTN